MIMILEETIKYVLSPAGKLKYLITLYTALFTN